MESPKKSQYPVERGNAQPSATYGACNKDLPSAPACPFTRPRNALSLVAGLKTMNSKRRYALANKIPSCCRVVHSGVAQAPAVL